MISGREGGGGGVGSLAMVVLLLMVSVGEEEAAAVVAANPIPTRVLAPSDDDEGGFPWLTHRGISARTMVYFYLL